MQAQSTTQALILRMLPNFNKLARQKRTATVIRSRLSCLQKYWETCQENHAKLCTLTDEVARQSIEYFAKDKFLYINDAVEEIRDQLSEYLESLQPHVANTTLDESQPVMNRTYSVHLPRIDIPKFAGDVTQWETFRDMFESLVASRADLTNVQKLHYLKANLISDASLVLSNVQVTDANYRTAWELLRKRYDNPRAIVNAHLQALVDIPSVSSQSVNEMKNLHDKTNEIYTALLNLKRPVNQWEDLMIFLTVSKLDKTTRRDWEISLGDSVELASFAELDCFLTSRIRALEAINPSSTADNRSSAKRSNKSGVVRSHQVSATDGRCVACDNNHPTYQCKAFANLTVEQRVALLKRNKCCFNCLRKGHMLGACRSNNVCTICKRKHHSLIHRENSRNDLTQTTNDSDTQMRGATTWLLMTARLTENSRSQATISRVSRGDSPCCLLPPFYSKVARVAW